ncbi:hypothetical protein EOJ36_04810 [Sandaracinomonas limnophila]|uniref:Uncharacterized protein n=1 Tax=Sandaracinomonas limnophila TaxID=1862386 RepID=A0A437PU34_9BACT|nr:hypothetical protein EOJ36_04810 [Sandaracinomonas limnophila]
MLQCKKLIIFKTSYTHLPLTYYLLPITSYLLPLTSYLLPLTSYLLPPLQFPQQKIRHHLIQM